MKTLKLLVLVLLGAFLVGCEDDNNAGVNDISSFYVLNNGMEGCTVNRVISKRRYADLYAVNCDGKKVQTTNHLHGKGQNTVTITINGVEYEATPKPKE